MHRFVVAVAHLHQVPRQFVRLRVALLDVSRKIAAVAANAIGVFVERFEQLQDFRELLFGQLIAVGQVAQAHLLRAELDEDFVQSGTSSSTYSTRFLRVI